MLFGIEFDSGAAVSGYIVGDGFVETARIELRNAGELVFEGDAGHPRDALVVAGRHRTGLCGFTIDETMAPGLSAMDSLEIREKETGVLIYRRPQPQFAQKRVLRLDTHLFPMWRLDQALNERFQYAANAIDALGRETTTQMFVMHHVNSIYLSGRLLYKNFQQQIEGHFDVVFTMHHPYEELAERLIVLAQIKRTNSKILGLRENMSLKSTMAFAQALPLEDEKALAVALRTIPNPVARVFANPVTRQLTASAPEEMPTKFSVTAALSVLSSFAVVGLRRAPATFGRAVSELADLREDMPTPSALPGVTALARMLKRSREVDWLIERDLALYHHIAEAYRGAQTRPAAARPPNAPA